MINTEEIGSIYSFAKGNFANEWLLYLELFEVLYTSGTDLEKEVLGHLENLVERQVNKELIENGLKIIYKNK